MDCWMKVIAATNISAILSAKYKHILNFDNNSNKLDSNVRSSVRLDQNLLFMSLALDWFQKSCVARWRSG